MHSLIDAAMDRSGAGSPSLVRALFLSLTCVALQASCSEDIHIRTGVREPTLPAAGNGQDTREDTPSMPQTDAGSDSNATASDSCTTWRHDSDLALADLADSSCSTIAAKAFRYALCACDVLTSRAQLTSDAFDSARGPYMRSEPGAGIGSNGVLDARAGAALSGTLVVGATGLASLTGGSFQIGGNALVGGDLVFKQAEATFDRELWVGRNIATTDSTVHVARTLRRSPESKLTGEIDASGGTSSEAVVVDDPCPCANRPLLDFDALRLSFSTNNDNASLGSPQAASLWYSSALELPCGRYLAQGGSATTARWVAHHTSVVFIDGDLEIAGHLAVDLGTTGELDVLISGQLTLQPGAQIAATRAGALRLYVNGASIVRVSGGASLACNLYAPTSQLLVSEEQTLYGALLFSTLTATAPLSIHYDRAVLRASGGAASCQEPACVIDSECRAPFLCVAGRCGLAQ